MNEQERKYIERLENSNIEFEDLDLRLITALAKNEDGEIRSVIAEVLCEYANEFSEGLLISMLNDIDELVRCNACDSLGSSHSTSCIPPLLEKIKDESELVRCYAILSVTDIIKSTKVSTKPYAELLKTILPKEAGIVRLACYSALYQFGEKKYLKRIARFLFSSDYHHQIFAIKTLKELKSDENKKVVGKALKKACEKSCPRSVKDVLEQVIKEITI